MIYIYIYMQARRSQDQAHRKESIIPGRTNKNIPNIMRDPPCARQGRSHLTPFGAFYL